VHYSTMVVITLFISSSYYLMLLEGLIIGTYIQAHISYLISLNSYND